MEINEISREEKSISWIRQERNHFCVNLHRLAHIWLQFPVYRNRWWNPTPQIAPRSPHVAKLEIKSNFLEILLHHRKQRNSIERFSIYNVPFVFPFAVAQWGFPFSYYREGWENEGPPQVNVISVNGSSGKLIYNWWSLYTVAWNQGWEW